MVVGRAGGSVKRGDAVVEQFAALVGDAIHQVNVLLWNNRVVAADVLPTVVHADIGVKGLAARRVKGGEAEGGIADFVARACVLYLINELYHWGHISEWR